jgi:small-conductance mechanosensitive channel
MVDMNAELPDRFRSFLTEPVRISEELSFTVLSLLLGIALFSLLLFSVGWVRRWFNRVVFPRIGLATGTSAALTNLLAYTATLVGALVILPVVFPGFNVSTLVVILGGLSLGIGFGLRNVADNFFSGLILLIERPVEVGDRIEINRVHGKVMAIRGRSTTVRTNDNIDIIVPNSQFITEEIVNLSHRDKKVRFKIPVGVHYQSDLHFVSKLLLEVASNCPGVLKDPKPVVRFLEFGDSALKLELRVWTESLYDRPGALQSELNFRIWDTFKEHGVEIPYPQRDLHIKSMTGSPGETKD